jgi:hypothetical protein
MSGNADDPFVLLGVPRGSSKTDIRRAYLSAAKLAHPDKGGDEGRFVKLKRAYEEALRGGGGSSGPYPQFSSAHQGGFFSFDDMCSTFAGEAKTKNRPKRTPAARKASERMVRLRGAVSIWRVLDISVIGLRDLSTDEEEAEQLVQRMRACLAKREEMLNAAERILQEIKSQSSPPAQS